MIRVSFISLLFICFFCINGLYSQDGPDLTELQKADKFIETGDLEQALVILKDYLFTNPLNIEAQERKINVLLRLNREKDAYKDIDDLLRMYSTSPDFYYLRAVLNYQKEKYVKAIEDFDKALRLNMPVEYTYKVHLNRGMSHFFLRDFELAEVDFNVVIKSEPNNGAAYHGLGMVKYEQREFEEAVDAFRKSLSFDEKNPITHFNMAMSYFRLKEKDNACYHFNRACALGNRNACKLVMLECAQQQNLPK